MKALTVQSQQKLKLRMPFNLPNKECLPSLSLSFVTVLSSFITSTRVCCVHIAKNEVSYDFCEMGTRKMCVSGDKKKSCFVANGETLQEHACRG